MRRLVWLGLLFAALWSGWWMFASASLRSGLASWLEERRDEGWQAEVSNIGSSGFPFALETTLEAPVLADPETGLAVSASRLDVQAPVWWPGHVSVLFPPDEIFVASPQLRQTIRADTAMANLRLHPGTALEVEQMALTSGPWSLSLPQGSIMSASGLTLDMTQAPEVKTQYAFTLDAPAFKPGTVPRSALLIPDDWPVAFDSLKLEMNVTFDRPIDRQTIETARSQPRQIDLTLAEAQWGALLLRSAAALSVAPGGVLSGEFSLQARNWREMLSLAETAGAIPAGLRPQLENVLSALAGSGGNPETIDVELKLRDGTIYLGFIPLGPAPLLVVR